MTSEKYLEQKRDSLDARRKSSVYEEKPQVKEMAKTSPINNRLRSKHKVPCLYTGRKENKMNKNSSSKTFEILTEKQQQEDLRQKGESGERKDVFQNNTAWFPILERKKLQLEERSQQSRSFKDEINQEIEEPNPVSGTKQDENTYRRPNPM